MEEIPFLPARVLMQDFTGVPSVVDISSIRSEVTRKGGNPDMINPKNQLNPNEKRGGLWMIIK